MAKTVHKKYLDKCLDDLHSQIIRRRARGKCELCGEMVGYDYLQRHHIFGRHGWMIWDLDGSAAVCSRSSDLAPNGCHELCREHKELTLGMFIASRGGDWYDKALQRSYETKQWHEWEMEEKVREFRERG